MKCYACGFEEAKKEWNKLSLFVYGTNGDSAFIGKTKNEHMGSVNVYSCPECGILITNMRGEARLNK